MEFKVNLQPKDMYRFNIYHNYTTTTGWSSIVIAALIFGICIFKRQDFTLSQMLVYGLFGVVFLLWIPLSLIPKSKQQVLKSEVLSQTLTYTMKDDALYVSSPAAEIPSQLPWDMIYCIKQSKHNLLIYSSRVNAFVIPLETIESQYDDIALFLCEKVDDYKLPKKIKKA